jgi:hypothetical protein
MKREHIIECPVGALAVSCTRRRFIGSYPPHIRSTFGSAKQKRNTRDVTAKKEYI